jgi:hypothetical protein
MKFDLIDCLLIAGIMCLTAMVILEILGLFGINILF